MNYELSDPTNISVIVSPAASKCVTGEAAVDDNPHVRACGVIGQVVRSNLSLTEPYVTT